MAPRRRNPTILMLGNPAPSPALRKSWKRFHFRDPREAEAFRIKDVVGVPRELLCLGRLVEIGVRHGGKQGTFSPARGEGPWLCFSPANGRLYALASRSGLGFQELGGFEACSVTYAPPPTSGKDPADYQHDFGRPAPKLRAMGPRALRFDGGAYRVTDWIRG